VKNVSKVMLNAKISRLIGAMVSVTVISLLLNIFLLSEKFSEEYEYEISNAKIIYSDIQLQFESRVNYWKDDFPFCAAIVFPEIIRYSILRDKMETVLLNTFYVMYGKKHSNYSIGLFQMKPSFVEHLEKESQQYSELNKFKFIWKYPSDLDYKGIRSLRVKRMRELKWQIDYLVCFINLIKQYYDLNGESLSFKTIKEKIAFYASAYNSGYWYDLNKIKQYQEIKLYPHGKNWYDNNKQYNYSDVSIYCYEKFILEE
jgi:hypothetical protein